MLSRFASSVRRFGTTRSLSYAKYPFLAELGLKEHNFGANDGHEWFGSGEDIVSVNAATREPVAVIKGGTAGEYERCLGRMQEVKRKWGLVPVPLRGEIVRKIGEQLRKHKTALGHLISLEMGKIKAEGQGEVQEAIDICDFAVGLSRSACGGSVIPSERPDHFMMERWSPLNGNFGLISAFNFPCAVAFWNTAISLVCGNTQVWKGASTTSLVTLASQKIVSDVLKAEGFPGVATMIQGSGSEIGGAIIKDKRNELISFTGSTRIGLGVSAEVSKRFGKTILELGGNNAMIVMDDANLDLALPAILFSAVGTAGQRCTTLRRLYLHDKIYDNVVQRLTKAYSGIRIGDPLEDGTLVGPLHTDGAVKEFQDGMSRISKLPSSKILYGGKHIKQTFVEPTLVAIDPHEEIIKEELFVPIMYIMRISSLDQAIQYNNAVPQGLSSSLFTRNPQSIFKWTGPAGSDCGIVNVNIGPSGAEIGGAFGGEKETGNGRESGSDSWKQYMRRSTCTINYGDKLTLAQGINFGN